MHALKDIEVFFLDWSGVISDDRRLAYEANKTVLASYRLSMPSYDEWLSKSPASGFIELMRTRGCSAPESEIREKYETACRELSNGPARPHIIDGARQFIETAARRLKAVVIVSKHPQHLVMDEARSYDIAHHLQSIYGGVEDKEGVINEFNRIRGSREKAAFIGDTTFDIAAAHATGALAIGVTTGYHPATRLCTANPHMVVRSLEQLLEYL